MEEELNKATMEELEKRLRRSSISTSGEKVVELVSRLSIAVNDPIEEDTEDAEDEQEVLNSSSHTYSIDNDQSSAPSTPPFVPQKTQLRRGDSEEFTQAEIFNALRRVGIRVPSHFYTKEYRRSIGVSDDSEEEDMDPTEGEDEDMNEEGGGGEDEEMNEQKTGDDHSLDNSIMSEDGAESTMMSEESVISTRDRRSIIFIPIVSSPPSAARKKSIVSVSATVTKEHLTTPKVVRLRSAATTEEKTKKGFKFGSPSVPKSFVFGSTAAENIQSVQKSPTVSMSEPSTSRRVLTTKQPNTDKKLDVKQRSRIAKSSSAAPSSSKKVIKIPVDLSFIDRMATPMRRDAGAIASRDRTPGRYTPYKGKVKFVDTTKLSDREFQIAVAAGLIKNGRSTTKKATNAQLEASRAMSRDALLDVKRKLKM